MKKRHLRKRAYVLLGCIVVLVLGLGIYFMTRPAVSFNESTQDIEINSTYNPMSFIKKVRGNKSDVTVDNSKVNVKKLGKYKITYTLNKKNYVLNVEVVDTKKPTFKVVNKAVEVGTKVKASEFVTDIKDETKTKTYFKKDVSFDKEGTQKVTVVVEDQGGNKTEKEVNVKAVKDTKAPLLAGLQNYDTTIGSNIDFMKGITVEDDFDKEPKVSVDSSKVDFGKAGTYKVIYTTKDKSGNERKYTQTVIVNNPRPANAVAPSGEKVVYLTFDDGPSQNTQRVLDILDRYHAKATFFVTGNGQKYNYLIQEAHKRGNTIALHTYCHDYRTVYASTDAYFNDLNKVGDMVKGLIGFTPRYIRFPGGSSNTVSRHYSAGIMSRLTRMVQEKGYQYYDWNVSSGDASGNNVPTARLIANATASRNNQIMILFHDTAAKNTTVEALPKVIEHYQSLGYTFKGIDDTTFTPHQRVLN